MGVDRPRVRLRRPAYERRQRGARGGPQPEGAVHVHPRAVLARGLHDLLERVDRAGVDVAGLGAHDRRPAPLPQGGRERVAAHGAVAVHRHAHDPALAEPHDAQRAQHGDVHLVAGEDAHRRRPHEPVRLDVPADLAEHVVPRRRQADRVARRGARHEADARVRGEAQEVERPAGRGPLDRHRRRGHRRARGDLVPARHQPVGGEAGGERPAHHEAEEARPGAAHQPRLGGGRELGDDPLGVLTGLGQRGVERGLHGVEVRGGPDAAGREGVQPGLGEAGRALEQRHGLPMSRRAPERASRWSWSWC